MAPQILEGTIAEIQQQINKMHRGSERRLKVIVEEETTSQEQPDLKGVRLFPVTDPQRTITTEEVLEIISRMEDEEYEDLPS